MSHSDQAVFVQKADKDFNPIESIGFFERLSVVVRNEQIDITRKKRMPMDNMLCPIKAHEAHDVYDASRGPEHITVVIRCIDDCKTLMHGDNVQFTDMKLQVTKGLYVASADFVNPNQVTYELESAIRPEPKKLFSHSFELCYYGFSLSDAIALDRVGVDRWFKIARYLNKHEAESDCELEIEGLSKKGYEMMQDYVDWANNE